MFPIASIEGVASVRNPQAASDLQAFFPNPKSVVARALEAPTRRKIRNIISHGYVPVDGYYGGVCKRILEQSLLYNYRVDILGKDPL